MQVLLIVNLVMQPIVQMCNVFLCPRIANDDRTGTQREESFFVPPRRTRPIQETLPTIILKVHTGTWCHRLL
jgi:hypothetical protein